ncbi:MAG: glutamine synthetase family protein [Candidatus Bilamarchaeaceae archaeon]
MAAIDDVLKYIATNEIKWVDFHFFGITGVLHRTTVSNRKVDEDTFGRGIRTADLRNVFGESPQGELVLLPDPDTLARIPWEPSTVRLISDIMAMPEKERFLKDSRYIAERIMTNLNAAGISEAKVGAEIDCYIFDTVTIEKTAPGRGTGAILDSREAKWGPSPLTSERGSYVSQPFDSMYAARCQIAETLEDNFGVLVDGHWHGESPTSQQTFELAERDVKTAADAVSTLKFVTRNLSTAVNVSSTFLPYPVEGERGNDLYISMSLWKSAENNIFYDANEKYAQLSQTARYFIGGLLEHARALAVFTAPLPNSYKRLAVCSFVSGWSTKRGGALVYIPYSRKNAKESARVVYKGADPAVNPYLAYAAVLAAGLYGIKNKIEPGDPVEEETKKRKEISLPDSLYEAIVALESDTRFIKGVVPPEFLESYLDKKLRQYKEDKAAVTMNDHRKYFNV